MEPALDLEVDRKQGGSAAPSWTPPGVDIETVLELRAVEGDSSSCCRGRTILPSTRRTELMLDGSLLSAG